MVVTAWRSEPEVSGRLFAAFYDALQDMSVPSAMMDAQRRIRSDPATAHPYFWAAPICSGEGSTSISALREYGII